MPDMMRIESMIAVGGAVVYPLAALTLITIVIILEKSFIFWRRTRLTGEVVALAESYAFGWDDFRRAAASLGRANYFRRFFEVVLEHHKRPSWWVESRAADEASLIEKSLGRWLWVLETTVTAAPLLGLLGTIIGMVRAFHLFGANGLVDPTGVTGGVAQALVTTALGLFIALIALFAFNFFAQRQAQIMDEMERFGTRLVDRIRLEQDGARHEAA